MGAIVCIQLMRQPRDFSIIIKFNFRCPNLLIFCILLGYPPIRAHAYMVLDTFSHTGQTVRTRKPLPLSRGPEELHVELMSICVVCFRNKNLIKIKETKINEDLFL